MNQRAAGVQSTAMVHTATASQRSRAIFSPLPPPRGERGGGEGGWDSLPRVTVTLGWERSPPSPQPSPPEAGGEGVILHRRQIAAACGISSHGTISHQ